MNAERHFEVKLKRSVAGKAEWVLRTLTGLGLRRMGRSVFLKDTPAVRGMIYKVVHMVDVQCRDGVIPPSARARGRMLASTKSQG